MALTEARCFLYHYMEMKLYFAVKEITRFLYFNELSFVDNKEKIYLELKQKMIFR